MTAPTRLKPKTAGGVPMKQVPLVRGELLADRKLVMELVPDSRPYLWIGCADDDGQHCVATVDLSELRKILPKPKRMQPKRAQGER